MVKNFYDLAVWKRSHKLSLEIYKLAKRFPKEEKYGIVDQLQRSSSSISANIAEGFGRYHYKDKLKFFYTARGSAYETQSFIFLAKDLGYINKEVTRKLLSDYEQLNKSLNALINVTSKQTS